MAKMNIRAARWTGRSHAIPIYSKVYKRGNLWEVCVMVGKTMGRGSKTHAGSGQKHPISKWIHACGDASNPRAALADALQRAGAQARKRSGAFAGYRRRSR